MPLIWAVAAAIFFQLSGVTPAWGPRLLSGVTIPVMLLLFGGALVRLPVRDLATSVLMAVARLFIGVGAGTALVFLFRLEGATAGAVFLLTAMPSALISYVIAEHCGRSPERVAGIMVSSAVIGFASLPAIVAAALYFAVT